MGSKRRPYTSIAAPSDTSSCLKLQSGTGRPNLPHISGRISSTGMSAEFIYTGMPGNLSSMGATP